MRNIVFGDGVRVHNAFEWAHFVVYHSRLAYSCCLVQSKMA